MNKQKIKQILITLLQGIVVVLTSVLIAVVLRVFLFASFSVPSLSMAPTIDSGDYILVNKLIPGPRVYKSLDFLKGAKVETRRFKGTRAIKRNDILVFNFPHVNDWAKIEMDLNTSYVKRCVAIPGDTFYIENGVYKVKNSSDTLGYFPGQKQLSLMKGMEFDPGVYNCYPYDSVHYNWNILSYGPLYVPRADDCLMIDTINYRLYKKLIEYETGKQIQINNEKVYLDNDPIDHYTFNQNYYFMAGDLVRDSRDSRYWGLLPEDHIIGKAWLIWKSKDPVSGKYRWKRFLKIIK